MPTLYRPPNSSLADEVQDALTSMVIAHDVRVIEPEDDLPEGLSRADLPALLDDGDLVTDPAAIRERVDALRTLMSDWEGFGSDACHIEDDGTIC